MRGAVAILAAGTGAAEAQQAVAGGAPAAVRLSGVVWDSVAARPLGAAELQVASMDDPTRRVRTATSDAQGRFVVDSLAAGRYFVSFYHPVLDSLGLSAPEYQLALRDAKPVTLGVPGPRRLVAAHCGGQSAGGAVIGQLVDARSRQPVAGGTVQAEWVELAVSGTALQSARATRTATTTAQGWFALCELPADAEVSVVAIAGGDTSGRAVVPIPQAGLVRRTLAVGSAPAPLRGVVRTAAGQPIEGARIRVSGTSLEVLTDPRGAFALDSVPGGTRSVETRKIGFWPDRRLADIAPGMPPVEILLGTVKSVLDTVKITASRGTYAAMEFARRRRSLGAGRFMADDEIVRASPIQTTDLLYRIGGIAVIPVPQPGGRFKYFLRQRGGSFVPWCLPAVFVDGMRVPIDDVMDINWLVPVQMVTALEVYSPQTAPPEFTTMTGCTTLAYWTEMTRPRVPTPVER